MSKILKNIDVLILCGGEGKRLRPVIGGSQKVMAQVQGKPFLDILLSNLKSQGIKRVILLTGYKSNEIEEYYKNNSQGLFIEISKEQAPLGTGGAIKNAYNLVKSDPFFVLNGDCLCDINLGSFLDFHFSSKAAVSIVVSKVKNNKDFGAVVLDENNNVIAFKEKSELKNEALVNAGIYCFNKTAFNLMPDKDKFSIEYEGFPGFVGHGFKGYVIDEKFFDIGTPERYKSLKTNWLIRDKDED